MNFMVHYPLSVISSILWLGFLGAISFMESWLKFRAPGVNLQTGLQIGKLVFRALNRMEWLFCLVIIIEIVYRSGISGLTTFPVFIPAVFILLLQTMWLLPALDQRANRLLQGETVPSSKLHLFFITAEVIKTGCLFILSIKLLSH